MSTLRDYYNTGDNGSDWLYGNSWRVQTFTTTSSYSATSVKLKLFKNGSPTGDITVSIYATSGGSPTGSPLTSGTYDSSLLSINQNTWYEISLTPYLLYDDTLYAIVVSLNGGDYSNGVNWRQEGSPSYYTGGMYGYSSNSGSSWTMVSGTFSYDLMFEVYGETVAPTVTTQAVSSITSTTATGNGNVTSDGGATVTERGVCWSTSSTPTTDGSKATASGTTGAFTASITGLSPSTLYYVRAYAINSVGTSYGSQVTFTTSAQKITFGEYLGAGSSTTKLLLHLNGNSTDSSGNGNNGTDTAITYGLANGKLGQGALFNGSSSKIEGFSSSISPVGSRTISAWIKPNSTGRIGICGTRPSSASTGFVFTLNRTTAGNLTYFHTSASSPSLLEVAGGISSGNWYNVIATYDQDSSTVKIYVNGNLLATQTGFVSESASAFNGIVGLEQQGGTTETFNGSIDELILESRAWTASEIKKYYTNSLGRF